ncbi:MAG: hypothetical protein HY671_01120 [Chloroflexi bacterium]|nr:hypothetical protein [Chloroflexota bacterium]
MAGGFDFSNIGTSFATLRYVPLAGLFGIAYFFFGAGLAGGFDFSNIGTSFATLRYVPLSGLFGIAYFLGAGLAGGLDLNIKMITSFLLRFSNKSQ